jgi:lysozyme
MILEGIDASSYQGVVNWAQVAQAGKAFAFVKATEGVGYQDARFSANWYLTRAHGLVRGAYHYLLPNLDGAAQADYFRAFVTASGGVQHGDFAILDCEQPNGLAHQEIVECSASFVQRVREDLGVNVIFYTYPNFWLAYLGDPVDPVLAQCPLWLADYGPSVPPLANWPGGLSFWQYSDTGHCPGVPGNVDLSRFYGTPQNLRQLAQLPH